MYILLCGEPPFHGETSSQTMRTVREGKYVCDQREWGFVSPSAQNLVKRMMEIDPAKRITPAEALDHPWISGRADGMRNPLPSAVVGRFQQFHEFGLLKQKALATIVQILDEDELAGFAKMFKELDENGDGEVSVHEVNEVLHQLGLPETDHDSKESLAVGRTLTYAEFVAACMGRNAYLQEERLFKMFEQFDADKSGTIDAAELEQMLGPDVDVKQVLLDVDTNNDGVVDYDEFCALMRRGGHLSSLNLSEVSEEREV